MLVVTGAAGFLGNALVRALLERRSHAEEPSSLTDPIKALVRPGGDTSCFTGLDVEVVEADIRDVDTLVEAFHEASGVFHLAGEVSIASWGLKRLRETNVHGTKCVIEACKRAGVSRLVYTSSIHALLEPPFGKCADEDSCIDPVVSKGPYAKTKAEATLLVLAAASKQLETVAVYPSGIIGPYDWRPSHLGRVVLGFAGHKLGAYVDGAYNFVDSRDVADGTVAAYERGRSGEGYLLCGHEVTVRELLDTIERVSGVPAPRLRLNFDFVRSVSPIIPVYYWISGQEPIFTSQSLDIVRSNCAMSRAKAERELDYSPRPFRDTIEDTIDWFRKQGMLRPATAQGVLDPC